MWEGYTLVEEGGVTHQSEVTHLWGGGKQRFRSLNHGLLPKWYFAPFSKAYSRALPKFLRAEAWWFSTPFAQGLAVRNFWLKVAGLTCVFSSVPILIYRTLFSKHQTATSPFFSPTFSVNDRTNVCVLTSSISSFIFQQKYTIWHHRYKCNKKHRFLRTTNWNFENVLSNVHRE